jgi:hypothetical protein
VLSAFNPSLLYSHLQRASAIPCLLVTSTIPSTQTFVEKAPLCLNVPVLCVADVQTRARGLT